MDASDKQSQRSSDSLFSQHDVTRSVEAVKICWEMEKARRRRLILRIILPILLLALVATAYSLMRSDFGKQLFSSRSHSGDHRHSGSDADPVEGSCGCCRGPGRSEGYEGAKIKVLAVIPGGTPRYGDLMRVLLDAVDNKPSEFHVRLVDLFDLNEESAEELIGDYCTAIVINGQKEFTVPAGDGTTRTVSFMENVNQNLSAQDLVTVLNQLHAEHYGPSPKPVVTLPEPEPDPHAEAAASERLPMVIPANHAHDDDAERAADADLPVIRLTLPTMKARE
ncbi:MAG: hypothetical protein ACOX9E_09820 [Lentisphaeria bacterium]|jgi:hypothetical protein